MARPSSTVQALEHKDEPGNALSGDEIFDIVIECTTLFESITGRSSKECDKFNAERKAQLDHLASAFDRWINYTGALAEPSRSLDQRLEGHPDIKDMVLNLLEMLLRNLHHVSQSVFIDTDQRDAAQAGRSLQEEAWRASEQAIDDLHFLAAMIRRSSTQAQKYHLSSNFQSHGEEHFEEYVAILVRRKFPAARRSLCDHLASSIAARRKLLLRKHQHEQNLSRRRRHIHPSHQMSSNTGMVSTPTSQPLQKPSPNMAQVELQRRRMGDNIPSSSNDSRSMLQSTVFRRQFKAGPALSAISTGSSVRDSNIDYPEKPKVEPGAKQCDCPICSEPLNAERVVRSLKYWHDHVDADVRPYVCLSEDCASPFVFFVHMSEWLDHMAKAHPGEWKQKIHMTTWYCDVGHDGEAIQFNDRQSFVEHMKDESNHPGRQPPSDWQIDSLSRKKLKALTRERLVCPICDCVPDQIRHVVQSDTNRDPNIDQILDKHIGQHIKALAFLSIPVLETDEAQDREPSVSQAEDEERKRRMSVGSEASFPSGLDEALLNLSLDDFQDAPATPSLPTAAMDVEETSETIWDDIGFDQFRASDTFLYESREHSILRQLVALHSGQSYSASDDVDDPHIVIDAQDARRRGDMGHETNVRHNAPNSDDEVESDFSQTGEHQATDDRDELQKIDDDLRAASEPGFNSDGRRYIPMDALQSIMCTKRIRAALSPISTEMTTQELASTIVPLLVDELDELRVIRSYQKIFAILILIGKHTAIEQFVVNNVYDDRLPITWSRKDDGHRKNDSRRKNDGRRKTDGRIKNDGPPWERFSNDALDSVGRAVECLGDWKPVDKEIFERTQWRLLAPSFTEGFHHPLKCEQPLPFMMIKDSEQYGTPQYSADFGHEHPITPGLNEDSETIVKIRIHRAHHTFPTYTLKGSDRNPGVAIKRSVTKDRETFRNALGIMTRLNKYRSDHLLRLLCSMEIKTIDNKDAFYMILPLAEGDLEDFWERNDPHDEKQEGQWAEWVAKQCHGLASAICKLHNLHDSQTSPQDPNYGFHASIHPSNLLWFKEWRGFDVNHREPGVLQIAGFGSSSVHHTDTRSTIDIEMEMRTYAPPESEISDELHVGFQSYDIWGLGCLFLEFLGWLVKGNSNAHREAFAEARQRNSTTGRPKFVMDTFYRLVRSNVSGREYYTEVNPAVEEFVLELQDSPLCSPFVKDLLEIIMQEMLVVEPFPTRPELNREFKNKKFAVVPGHKARKRISGVDVARKLRQLIDKTNISPGYFSRLDPQTLQAHRPGWIEKMEAFSKEFKTVLNLDKQQEDKRLNPVLIALVDDGVDVANPELRGALKGGLSLLEATSGVQPTNTPYHQSTTGHGTLMARLIRRVCPSALIHPIRIGTLVEGSSTLEIDPSTAVRALYHAVDRGAQIILTSWVVRPPMSPKVYDEFSLAVWHAQSRRVLICCCANYMGNLTSTSEFTRLDDTCLITAWRSSAKVLQYSVAFNNICYILPGDDVIFSIMTQDEVTKHNGRYLEPFGVHSGASIAAALGAGLMALIIECVRMGVVYENDSENLLVVGRSPLITEELVYITDVNVMQRLFRRLGRSRDPHGGNMGVWDMLNAEALRGSEEHKVREIARMARVILHK